MSAIGGRRRDPDYVAWVKTLPCAVADEIGLDWHCEGGIEADHMGRRPLGRKADDDTCVPLCSLHHRQRTDFSGRFRTWGHDEMRAWLDVKVELYQARYRRWCEAWARPTIPF